MNMQPRSGSASEDINTPDHPNRAPDAVPVKEAPGHVDREPSQAPQAVPAKPASLAQSPRPAVDSKGNAIF